MRSLFTVIGLVMLTSSCASKTTVFEPTEPTVSYPVTWPDLLGDNASDCASINGRYRSLGKSNSNLGPRFERPVFESMFFGMDQIASESNHFELSVVPEKKIMVVVFDESHKLLDKKRSPSSFECINGIVVFSSFVEGGNGESTHISTARTTRMMVDVNGSLVVQSKQHTISRKYLFAKETSTSEIWYQYPALRAFNEGGVTSSL